MAQPVPYVRQQEFSDYQTANPGSFVAGSDLDAEFDASKTTIDDILESLVLLLRDDGAMANGSVHQDAFTTASLALMAGSWSPKGDWATATAYIVGDVVEESSIPYVCVVAHTSGTFSTDLTAVKWMKVLGAASSIPYTPVSPLIATQVQAALDEIVARYEPHRALSVYAHGS